MATKLSDINNTLKSTLPVIREKYAVEFLGIFGSYLRNEQTPNSDLDLLVSFSEVPSLLKFIELENYLTDLLGIKVDLVMKEALKPGISKNILDEVEQV